MAEYEADVYGQLLPVRKSELLAQMEVVRRRAQPDVAPGEVSLIQVGELAIDLAACRVVVDGAGVNLAPTEYHSLTYMPRHTGQVLTHGQICAEAWREEYGGENH